MKGGFGMTLPEVLAYYDPDSSSWRTCAVSALLEVEGSSDAFSGPWPSSGMTRAGKVYALPTLAPPIPASATFSLLKTPTAQLASNGGSQHPAKRKAGGHGPTLADEVEHLLPTPAVNDMGGNKTLEWWDAWVEKTRQIHNNGNGHGKSLAIEMLRLLTSATTPPPSDGGSDSPDQPLHLFSLDGGTEGA